MQDDISSSIVVAAAVLLQCWFGASAVLVWCCFDSALILLWFCFGAALVLLQCCCSATLVLLQCWPHRPWGSHGPTVRGGLIVPRPRGGGSHGPTARGGLIVPRPVGEGPMVPRPMGVQQWSHRPWEFTVPRPVGVPWSHSLGGGSHYPTACGCSMVLRPVGVSPRSHGPCGFHGSTGVSRSHVVWGPHGATARGCQFFGELQVQ